MIDRLLSRSIRAIWTRLYGCICFDCELMIWPWQARHSRSHATCHHRALQKLHERASHYYGVQPWSCAECGWVSD